MTIWKNVLTYHTEGSSLNINKDRSGGRRTERKQEEKFIDDPRILARKYCLDIS